MRLLLLIFIVIAKLNIREIFYNHQIAKSSTCKMFFFQSRDMVPARFNNFEVMPLLS